jgi:hypothetical protein
VTFHRGYLAFCRDWDVQPRACAPYRARTKGKVASAVRFVKRNALPVRSVASFAAREQYLTQWMDEADQRVHGTTPERPCDRFVCEEQAALRPLPARPLPRREQRRRRRVASGAVVDVETVRYSVPYQLVRDHVDVAIDEQIVRIFHGTDLVTTHARSREPFARIVEPAHLAGLWRVPTPREPWTIRWPHSVARSPSTSGGPMSAIIHACVVEHLQRLRLGFVAERLDAVLNEAAKREPTHLDFLDQVLRQEVEAKQRKRVAMGVQIAHFPTVKTSRSSSSSSSRDRSAVGP